MPAPDWENLDDFLSTDDFATTATFTRAGGQVIPDVRCIFDEPFFDKDLGEYVQNAGEPRLNCKEADVATLKRHDRCTVAGVPRQFELAHDPQPDGTGWCVVTLMLA